MTEYQKEQIIKLRAEGTSYGSIAKAVDVPVGTVNSFRHRKYRSHACDITHRRIISEIA